MQTRMIFILIRNNVFVAFSKRTNCGSKNASRNWKFYSEREKIECFLILQHDTTSRLIRRSFSCFWQWSLHKCLLKEMWNMHIFRWNYQSRFYQNNLQLIECFKRSTFMHLLKLKKKKVHLGRSTALLTAFTSTPIRCDRCQLKKTLLFTLSINLN